MTWEAQLCGESADLKMLSESFTEPQLRIVSRENDVMIVSDNWDDLLTAEEVREAADRAAAAISGASFLILGMTTPLTVGNVYKVDEDGRRDITIFCNSGEVRVRTFPATITAGSVTHYPADPVHKYYEAASRDPAIERALSLRSMDSPNWVRLYILYEIVKNDVGNLMHTAGWVAKAEIKRFSHTANSPSATGSESRHGTEAIQPPTNPMSIQTARELIDRLLHEWIKSKQRP
jgi:hypothetical protein